MILHWRMPFRFARAMWHAAIYAVEGRPVITPKPILEWRRSRCAGCEENTRTLWPQCRKCACALEPKTLLSSESCPLGRWSALDNSPNQSNQQ